MKLVRPKILGTLTIQKMMAGNLAVVNDIKNAPNKIIIPCRSKEHGDELIDKLKNAKPGDIIYL
mgnify:CR=1 FL=1